MIKRKILILLFAILAITSDMIAIYLIKSGYNVPIKVELLAFFCCSISFFIIRLIDTITVIRKKDRMVYVIEREINKYLQEKGFLIRMVNQKSIKHMLLVTRSEAYSIFVLIKQKN